MDRVVFATMVDCKPWDHVTIKSQLLNTSAPSSQIQIDVVEEELRSCILRLAMLETSLKKLPEGRR